MDNSIDQSIQVPGDTIESVISNLHFPFLISFPRTGSHWLRMLMELYFQKPSLVRVFYYKDATRFTCYHRHDEKLEIERKNVIYLYRMPVDTVYSQMNYCKEDLENTDRVRYWANRYAKHLRKWLIDETFTEKKTILTYEGLKNNTGEEFAKICEHFNTGLRNDKLTTAVNKVTKNEVKIRAAHDPQVINISKDYQINKQSFARRNEKLILKEIISADTRLEKFLGESERLSLPG